MAMVSFPVNPTRQLVGRAAQLAVAEVRLDDLARSSGSLLLLVGEAGIGKTRLAEEVVGLARGRGARAAWATAWQGDGAPPLWPWAEILRQLTGSAGALDQPPPETPTASSAARFAQFQSIVAQLLGAAAAEPLVLVIDDLQWADTGSVRLLTFAAAAIRDAPCLLLATYRPDELSHGDRAELARVGTTLAVPPLPDAAAAELVRVAAGVDVSPTAVAAIIARSGGNPLFVSEFGQLMAQSGRRDVAPAAIPAAVSGVIERRLAHLPEDAVALLRVAAVAANPFSAALVSGVAGIAEDDAAAGLEAAAAAGLITATTAQPGFDFSHDLVREVVLENVDPATRRDLHRRAARALEPLLSHDPSFHAVIADHLSRAGTQHAAAASAHWEQAGRRAQRLLAYEDAAEFFARAARACVADPARHGALLVVEGEALLLTGDLDAARARFTDAAAAARVIKDPELNARAVLGVEQVGGVLHAAEVLELHRRAADRNTADRAPPRQRFAQAADPTADTGNLFRLDGQFWTLRYRAVTVWLKDAKGLHDLGRLLRQPGRELHVLDLVGGGAAAGVDGNHRAVGRSDLGELLDARARAEYRRRLAELDDELDDAETCADLARIDQARTEREFLADELAAALGIGGRPRRAGDPVERARKAVTGRIRMTISRIGHEHPALGRHLRNAVRTGTYCAYEPETAVFWGR
jgi:tetratricopeptide (TPR) repeat protein